MGYDIGRDDGRHDQGHLSFFSWYDSGHLVGQQDDDTVVMVLQYKRRASIENGRTDNVRADTMYVD